MGLLLSKEEAWLREVKRLLEEVCEQYYGLGPAAAAEKAAGIPPLPGTEQALRAAVHAHISPLWDEQLVLIRRIGALENGELDVPPMPKPTPPLQLVLAPPAAACPPEQPCGGCVEPSTPMTDNSSPSKRLRGRRSSMEAAAASGANGSEAVPLLAAGAAEVLPAGLSAAGLRQRSGQHQETA